jgi:hypothetical protein
MDRYTPTDTRSHATAPRRVGGRTRDSEDLSAGGVDPETVPMITEIERLAAATGVGLGRNRRDLHFRSRLL